MEFPTIKQHELWHVGTMKINEKGNHSYEGAGLSVSLHPEEWSKIARLGGELFTLLKEFGTFIDFHALTAEQIEVIINWGLSNGFIETSKIYFYLFYDEDEREMSFETNDYNVALNEADGEEVFEKDGFTATELLLAETLQTDIGPGEVISLLTTVYVDKELKNIDGVWWDDDLDVYALSAPRGVILREKLSEWKITKE